MLRKAGFWENKKVRLLLCLELFLVLIGVVGLFGKQGVIVGQEDTEKLITEGVPLEPGVYKAVLYYAADGEIAGSFTVTAEGAMFQTLLVNDVPIYGGLESQECEFYLRDRTSSLKVVLNISENVRVHGLELTATNKGSRIWLFWVIPGSLALNAFAALFLYHRRYSVPKDRLLVSFGLPFLALTASIPSLVDYNLRGADLIFHMERIEALTQSLLRGEWHMRLEAMWMRGHGYANSLFYGDTFLMIPAMLRVLGFSPDSAYRIFMVSVNLAAALIAYVSFSKCFQSRVIGMFGSALYVLAPYRIYNMYGRAAVGETVAMIFLPLLAWGFYKIYMENPEEKGYFRTVLILAAGYSGLIQSHVLSCEMAGAFTAMLCLILWKKTFQKRVFLALCGAVGLTVLLNAWFLVPFLDMMQADQYYFHCQVGMLVQSKGVLPAQIFYTLQAGGNSSHFAEKGMVGAEPIGLGAALLACAAVWVWLRVKSRASRPDAASRQERRTGDVVFGLLALALYMSTCYFPWDFLSSCGPIPAMLVGAIQFPTRIMALATLLGVFLACAAGAWILREGEEFASFLPGRALLAGIALTAFVFGNYQFNDILMNKDFLRIYTAPNMGNTTILGAEYLPMGSEISHVAYHKPVLSDGIWMSDYEKDGLRASAYVEAVEEGYIEFPFLYYKGYRAEAVETGETLAAVPGGNYDVRVEFPAGFRGTVRVWYAGMWYWRAAEAVSVFTAGLLLFLYGKKKVSRIFQKKIVSM